LCEPLPARPGGAWLPWAGGVVLLCAGVVDDVVVPLPVEALDVDVAAFAIAAPPPAIAAVAATVTSSGFSLRICSPPFWLTQRTFLVLRRTSVGGA
jgi:hypothetical protein